MAVYLGSQIRPASQVLIEALDGINRAPRNAPPTGHEGQQSPWYSAQVSVFSRLEKVDARGLANGHYQDRHTIAVLNESCAIPYLKLQLLLTFILDANDLHARNAAHVCHNAPRNIQNFRFGILERA